MSVDELESLIADGDPEIEHFQISNMTFCVVYDGPFHCTHIRSLKLRGDRNE